jgi:hypothetical protein
MPRKSDFVLGTRHFFQHSLIFIKAQFIIDLNLGMNYVVATTDIIRYSVNIHDVSGDVSSSVKCM